MNFRNEKWHFEIVKIESSFQEVSLSACVNNQNVFLNLIDKKEKERPIVDKVIVSIDKFRSSNDWAEKEKRIPGQQLGHSASQPDSVSDNTNKIANAYTVHKAICQFCLSVVNLSALQILRFQYWLSSLTTVASKHWYASHAVRLGRGASTLVFNKRYSVLFNAFHCHPLIWMLWQSVCLITIRAAELASHLTVNLVK